MKIAGIFLMLTLWLAVTGCDVNKKQSPLVLRSFNCEQDAYEGNVVAFGDIKNVGNADLYNLTGMVELHDANNVLVGTWSGAVTPNPLTPGQSARFTIQTQHRVNRGTCRVYVANTMGSTILPNQKFIPVATQMPR